MNILDCLKVGKANAITRSELSVKTGMKDRDMRKEIHDLRIQGELIISSSHGKGYYLAESDNDIGIVIRESISRVRNEVALINAFKKKLTTPGQIKL